MPLYEINLTNSIPRRAAESAENYLLFSSAYSAPRESEANGRGIKLIGYYKSSVIGQSCSNARNSHVVIHGISILPIRLSCQKFPFLFPFYPFRMTRSHIRHSLPFALLTASFGSLCANTLVFCGSIFQSVPLPWTFYRLIVGLERLSLRIVGPPSASLASRPAERREKLIAQLPSSTVPALQKQIHGVRNLPDAPPRFVGEIQIQFFARSRDDIRNKPLVTGNVFTHHYYAFTNTLTQP